MRLLTQCNEDQLYVILATAKALLSVTENSITQDNYYE